MGLNDPIYIYDTKNKENTFSFTMGRALDHAFPFNFLYYHIVTSI